MSADLNIFNETLPQDGEFFNFKEVGDAIQGTYIDSREGIDGFDNEQDIYVIKDKDNKIWNVGFRKTNTFIQERMKNIVKGQIVGFRFDEERETKMGSNKAKIIKIYADNKFIDTEWMESQKKLNEMSGVKEEAPKADYKQGTDEPFKSPDKTEAATVTPPTATSVPETNEENEALNAIRQLARTKELTNGATTSTEEDEIIEAFAEMKLEEENFTKIIVALTGYTKTK